MLPLVRVRASVGCVVLAVMWPAVTFAQSDHGLIDEDLAGQIDFRDVAFSECSALPTCRVGDLTLRAERRNDEDTAWLEALIYWDPIDGIGVTDGGQNDEIDFDERIVVTFDVEKPVSRVWLSDLFLGEDPRYGSTGENIAEEVLEDVEVAGLSLRRADVELDRLQIVGDVQLPPDPFNEQVSRLFREDGDLRRRIIIQEEIISVVAPDPRSLDSTVLLQSFLGTIDKDKRTIFDGVETFEIDLAQILDDFHGARLFAVGTTNFESIQRLLDEPQRLEDLRLAGARMRAVSDWDNGEFCAELATPLTVDTLEFFAPFDSSNDFSVAGVVLADLAGE